MEDTHSDPPANLTLYLGALGRGDPQASQTLMPYVYGELRKIAHARLRGQPADALIESSELIHETFLRLFGKQPIAWNDRKHFFALSAKAMRQLLVDHARRKRRDQDRQEHARGLHESVVMGGQANPDLLALEEALVELQEADPRQAQIVDLRYFVGLEHSEVADIVGVSTRTVEREWRAARAWLGRRLESG